MLIARVNDTHPPPFLHLIMKLGKQHRQLGYTYVGVLTVDFNINCEVKRKLVISQSQSTGGGQTLGITWQFLRIYKAKYLSTIPWQLLLTYLLQY